ncbi:hypothetical protein GCM10029964_089150 [Kibdelosporangium lantanae]
MAVLAGVLGLLACSVLLVLVALLSEGGLPVAANVAQLVSIPLATVPLLVALWAWRRARALGAVAITAARLAEVQSALAVTVEARWTEEARLRGVLADPIPVPWRVTHREGLQDRPAAISTGSLLLLESGGQDIARLAHDFRHRLARQRLVLLGAAGTGKTSLAVLLLLQLIQTRTADDRVPVLVAASSWDPDRHPEIADWLTERLAEDYPHVRAPEVGDAARLLVRHQRILPVLDGLDELAPTTQAPDAGRAEPDLADRPTDPDQPHRRLRHRGRPGPAGARRGARAGTRPAGPGDGRGLPRGHPGPAAPGLGARADRVARDGRAHRPGGRAGRGGQHGAGPVAARSVYFTPRLDPASQAPALPDPTALLAVPTAERMRAGLWDELIPALLAARPPHRGPRTNDGPLRPRHAYDPAQVRQWLSYLAAYLTTTPPATLPAPTTFHYHVLRRSGTLPPAGTLPPPSGFLWWELALRTGAVRPRHRLAPGITAGLLFVVVLYVWAGWPLTVASALTGTAVIGILVLGGWWDVATWPYQRPDLVDLRLRRQSRARWTVLGALWWLLKRYVSILAPFGVALLVVEAVTSTPLVRNVRGLGEFLALGLAVWVVLVLNQLFDLLEAPTPVHTAATPMSSWRGNRALNLLRLALAVPNLLVPALVLPRLLLAAGSAATDTPLALLLVVLVAPTVFLSPIATRHNTWYAYRIAVRRLARQHRLPLDLMSFLDDAHRLGLLRTVGAAYQFRHDTLRVYLTPAYRQSTTGDPAPDPPSVAHTDDQNRERR